MLKPETTFHFTAEGIKALKPEATRVDYWDASLNRVRTPRVGR